MGQMTAKLDILAIWPRPLLSMYAKSFFLLENRHSKDHNALAIQNGARNLELCIEFIIITSLILLSTVPLKPHTHSICHTQP